MPTLIPLCPDDRIIDAGRSSVMDVDSFVLDTHFGRCATFKPAKAPTIQGTKGAGNLVLTLNAPTDDNILLPGVVITFTTNDNVNVEQIDFSTMAIFESCTERIASQVQSFLDPLETPFGEEPGLFRQDSQILPSRRGPSSWVLLFNEQVNGNAYPSPVQLLGAAGDMGEDVPDNPPGSLITADLVGDQDGTTFSNADSTLNVTPADTITVLNLLGGVPLPKRFVMVVMTAGATGTGVNVAALTPRSQHWASALCAIERVGGVG